MNYTGSEQRQIIAKPYKIFIEINNSSIKKLPFTLMTIGRLPNQRTIQKFNGINAHEFIWVVSGQGEFIIDGHKYNAEPGSGFFIRKGTPHSYQGDHMYTEWYTFLGGDSVLELFGVGNYFTFETNFKFSQYFAEIEEKVYLEKNIFTRSALGYTLFMSMMERIFSVETDVSAKIRSILENRYAEQFSLDDLSLILRVNKFDLCHEYKAKYGIGIMQDLTKIRIEKAKRLLLTQSCSTAEIGKLCGFESPSYFTYRFREECGVTPLEYRKKEQLE